MNPRTPLRFLLAVLLGTLGASARAQGGTITGTVEATPSKYLDETVVYLKNGPPAAKPRTLAMDQRSMAFVPKVLVVAVGDTVKFLNHDKVVHNVYSPDGEGFNLGSFKQDEERTYVFTKAGPYTQLCSIHPEMLGFVYVAPGPHGAAVDKSGKFTITGVPPGTYTLAVWNSHLKGAEKSVTVAAGQTVTEHLTVKR
jgi:plastocyanin